MITAEKFPATNGNPPGVRVRFTWIEPTHEVVELLQKENLTEAFRSVDGAYVLEGLLHRELSEEAANEYLDAKTMELVNMIGQAIVNDQNARGGTQVELPEQEDDTDEGEA